MRDLNRIDRIINKLRAAWHAYPDMRFGQLVEDLCCGQDPFYTEDEKIEECLDEYNR